MVFLFRRTRLALKSLIDVSMDKALCVLLVLFLPAPGCSSPAFPPALTQNKEPLPPFASSPSPRADAPSVGLDTEVPLNNGGCPPPLRSTSDIPANDYGGSFYGPYESMTILIAALFMISLAVGFCAQYMNMAATRHRRAIGVDPELSAQDQELHEQRGESPRQGRSGAGGGLQPSMIRALPTLRYSVAMKVCTDKEEALPGTARNVYRASAPPLSLQDCTVCLSEFEDGDEVKELPRCGHAFHSVCIDKWLYFHHSCPICRLTVLPSPKAQPLSHAPHDVVEAEDVSRFPSSDLRFSSDQSRG